MRLRIPVGYSAGSLFAARRSRRAFTLIEMIVVFFLLAIILAIIAVALLQVVNIERKHLEGSIRLVKQSLAADQFRADVADAVDAPPRWRDELATSRRLILRQRDGECVIYEWADKTLTRVETGTNPQVRQQLYHDEEGPDLTFARTSGATPVITMKLEGPRVQEGAPPRYLLEISAALAGDAR